MPVVGLLLTGGASQRLGVAKATLLVHGERLVDRSARVLSEVCDRVLVVGGEAGSIDAVREEPGGQGPLAAFAWAATRVREEGHEGPLLLLAVDLPFVEAELLRWLVAHPASDSVVPRLNGVPQSLCARYAPGAAEDAATLVAEGERSMRALLAMTAVTYVDESEWGTVADPRAFLDVDTAEDAARAGLETPG